MCLQFTSFSRSILVFRILKNRSLLFCVGSFCFHVILIVPIDVLFGYIIHGTMHHLVGWMEIKIKSLIHG
jgi:hypothetical protein